LWQFSIKKAEKGKMASLQEERFLGTKIAIIVKKLQYEEAPFIDLW